MLYYIRFNIFVYTLSQENLSLKNDSLTYDTSAFMSDIMFDLHSVRYSILCVMVSWNYGIMFLMLLVLGSWFLVLVDVVCWLCRCAVWIFGLFGSPFSSMACRHETVSLNDLNLIYFVISQHWFRVQIEGNIAAHRFWRPYTNLPERNFSPSPPQRVYNINSVSRNSSLFYQPASAV